LRGGEGRGERRGPKAAPRGAPADKGTDSHGGGLFERGPCEEPSHACPPQ